MAIIQKINDYFKKFSNFSFKSRMYNTKIFNENAKIFLPILIIFTFIFFIGTNFISDKNEKNKVNLNEITNSNEFTNLKNIFISKISSPYKEINYLIKKNDTIEKILKKNNVRTDDINKIAVRLKQKKLSNIYSGRQLSLIVKKLEDGSFTVVNLLFPINNTTSIEIRKNQEDFFIKENILKLTKNEVVIRNTINNNLYNAAVEANIEPNIIVEFARIFGFEVDFQRDIRKGDWFEIYYEKFKDDNGKVKDTGKIIYASMFVNGDEINLYNFNYKNEEEYYDIKGKSITKSLMKTPINGARLSSHSECESIQY